MRLKIRDPAGHFSILLPFFFFGEVSTRRKVWLFIDSVFGGVGASKCCLFFFVGEVDASMPWRPFFFLVRRRVDVFLLVDLSAPNRNPMCDYRNLMLDIQKSGKNVASERQLFYCCSAQEDQELHHRLHVHLRSIATDPALQSTQLSNVRMSESPFLFMEELVLLNHRDLVLVSSDSSMWPIGCFACDALPTPVP